MYRKKLFTAYSSHKFPASHNSNGNFFVDPIKCKSVLNNNKPYSDLGPEFLTYFS